MSDADFDRGIQHAQDDINAIRSEMATVHRIFALVESRLCEALKSSQITGVKIEGYKLSLVETKTNEIIGWLEFQPKQQQFFYCDFRGIPKYPLPPNAQSIPVALGYFGISSGYFRAMKEYPELHLDGDSIRVRRDFL